jgi:putative NADH-flavin reductase
MKEKDMKIAVYGGTGAIGSAIATEASARGHGLPASVATVAT